MAEFLFSVLDWHDKLLVVELSIRRDTVECRCGGRLEAIFDREVMSVWLAAPTDELTIDAMTWQLTVCGIAVEAVHAFPRQTINWSVVDYLRMQLNDMAK